MPPLPSILCACLLTLLASAPAPAAQVDVDEAWLTQQRKGIPANFNAHHGPRFTLLTDLPADLAVVYLQALESTGDAFYRELPALGCAPEPPKERLVCILFRRADHFRAFHRQAEGADPAWGTGHYSQRTNRVTLYHDLNNPAFAEIRKGITELEDRVVELQHELENPPPEADDIDREERQKKLAAANDALADRMARLAIAAREATAAKIRHEAAHQLFFNSGLMIRGREYPVWLSEGLAMLFEPADAAGKVAFAAINPHRLPTLRSARDRKTLLSLEQLLAYTPDDGNPREVADAYAQAWALLHYLRHQKPEGLSTLVRAAAAPAARPADWTALFRRHVGMDLAATDADLHRHIERLERINRPLAAPAK